MLRMIWILAFLNFVISPVAGASREYFLVINTTGNDSSALSRKETYEGLAISRLEKKFPNAVFVTIHVTSNEELRTQLKSYGGNDVKLMGMFVMSHGHTSPSTDPSKTDKGHHSIVSNESYSFFAALDSAESVRGAFGPIIGRFEKGALIVFDGCSVLGLLTPGEKIQQIKQIAANFQLTEGSLYVNTVKGSMGLDTLFLMPLSEAKDTGEACKLALFKGMWPVTATIGTLAEMFSNQGYQINIGRRHVEIFEQSWRAALKGSEPKKLIFRELR